MRFSIKYFEDYHEVLNLKGGRVLELGTFFVKGKQFAQYFAVLYKGKKPPFEKVVAKMLKLVKTRHMGQWPQTKTSVISDIKRNAYWSGTGNTIKD